MDCIAWNAEPEQVKSRKIGKYIKEENEINIDILGNGQTLKSFKFSNDKINAVLGLKDSIRKYIIDLLLKKQEGE